MRSFRILMAGALAALGLSVVVAGPANGAGSITGFDQCDKGSPSTSCSNWITGNLNGGYNEDQVVPQRAVLDITSPGPATFAFSYQDLIGSNGHGIDYLATWNYTQSTANPCQGIAAVCGSGPASFPIPSDTANRGLSTGGYSTLVSDHELPQADRQLKLYGGATITGATITHSGGDGILTVTVNATSTGTNVLLFGAHVALTGPNTNPRAWLQGASTLSGVIQFQVVTGGAATHPMKVGPAATPPPPPASFTIAKSASVSSGDPGDPVTYNVRVTNTGGTAGTASFVDDYDNNLTNVTTPSGCTAGSGTLNCTTDSIAPGGQQVFSYTANLPATFAPPAGTFNCSATQYAVRNTATLSAPATGNSSATVCVDAAPSFTVTKTASPSVLSPSGQFSYIVTVTNNGSAPGATTWSDNFDDRLTPGVAGSLPTGNNCVFQTISGDKQFSDCATMTLPAGASQTFTYGAQIPSSLSGDPGGGDCTATQFLFANSVSLPNGATAHKDVCVNAAAGFTIDKSVDDDSPEAGGTVNYTITVTNNGNAAGVAKFTDDYDNRLDPAAPAGCTKSGGAFQCTSGIIPAGESESFTYAATMPDSFTGASGPTPCGAGTFRIRNTATLTTGVGSDVQDVCVSAAPAFSVEKTVDDAHVSPGATVTYAVTVKNTGTATGSSSFTDDYDNRLTLTLVPGSCSDDGDVLTCGTVALDPDQSETFTIKATVPETFAGASGEGEECADGEYRITNSATATGGATDSQDVCVTAAPAWDIDKDSDVTSASPGGAVEYTITVSNTGTAAGSTSFTDDYDNRITKGALSFSITGGSCTDDGDVLSCTSGTVPAGQTQTITYTGTMPSSFDSDDEHDGSCYPVGNTASLGDDDATVTVCVNAAPEFTISKSASTQTAAPGQEVEYTVTVTNTGAANGATTFTDDYANGVTVTTPAGCTDDGDVLTCATGDLAALGGSVDVTYTATMPATFGANAPQGECDEGEYAIGNTAGLVGSDGSDSVEICVDADAQFSIEKSVDDEDAEPGQTVHYTITVSNNGTAAGSTSFVDDYDNRLQPTVPAGCSDADGTFTCTTGSIAAGGHETFEYDATLPDSFGTDSGAEGCDAGTFRVRNAATITDGPGDSATVCVTAAPDVSISKSVDDEDAEPGQTVHYTITVSNAGDAASLPVTFTDDYEDSLTSVTLPAGCTAGTGAFTCTTGTIAAGGHETFEYDATLPESFSGESGDGDCDPGTFPVANSVSAGAQGPGDTVTICSPAAPHFVVAKKVSDANADPGEEITYTVTVTNDGTASGSTSFTDDYDNLLEPSTPEGCVQVLGTLTCTTGTLEAGESQEFTYTATVPTTFTGEPGGGDCEDGEYRIANGVTETSGATAGQDVCVSASPAFTASKSVDDDHAEPGQTLTYTVTVTNSGNAAGATTVVDEYDARLLDVGTPDGCVQDTDANTLTCTTGELLAGVSQDFVYKATLPTTFSGDSGTEPCNPGEYAVANAVVSGETTLASKTVCVAAAPKFEVTKTADDTTATPGQTIGYSITVSNTGSVAGATTAIDDFDDRLTPSVPDGCTSAEGVLTCTTGVIQPGGHQTFDYTAAMPATYTGDSGTSECPAGSYGVVNGVTVPGDAAAITVCVTAAPNVELKKTDSLETLNDGSQLITYTLSWTNTGPAEATDVTLADQIPTGTTFVSCTGDCGGGGSPAIARWATDPIAPLVGAGSVQLVVRVTTNQACQVSNTASIHFDGADAIDSNTVITNITPQPDPSTAKSNGSGVGLSVRTSGVLDIVGPLVGHAFTNNNTLTVSRAQSSQLGVGGPTTQNDSLLTLKIPANGSLVRAGLITATSASSVTAAPAQTRQTSTAEVADVCLVPVLGTCTVQAGVVRGVANTMANGSFAAASSTGSTITNLRVVNTLVPVDLNQTTTIPLNAGIFGKNSYVAINERSGSAGLVGSKYVADQSVAMIHVKITGLLGIQAAEIYVGQVSAHSEFDKTLVCSGGSHQQSVSGHAYNARLFTGPLLADLLLGYVQLAPLGGAETQHIADVQIPRYGVIANAKVADSSTTGFTTGSASASQSFAEVAGDASKPLCVLSYVKNCVVKATAIRSEARSLGGGLGSVSTDSGTKFLDLSVFGIPIAGTPKPNTVIPLPGIGFIILNEQFCDNGFPANGTCAGPAHSGITVRAVRVVITVANNLLGLTPGIELVLSEAHADSTYASTNN